MIHFDQSSRRGLSLRVGWKAWRILLAAAFAAIVIGAGVAPSSLDPATAPATSAPAVAVWDDGPAETTMIREAPNDPRSFIIADPRAASSVVAHLLIPALGATLLWFGVVRPLSVDMPVLPVRRWKGRTLGVPLHRGPPAPAM